MKPSNYSTPLVHAALWLLASTYLSGCALMGEAAIGGTLGRTVLTNAARSELALLGRSGLRVAGTELVVADATAFRGALSGLRMQRSAFGRTQLVARGESTAFAEVLPGGNRLKLLRTGQQVELPGTLYRVNSNQVNVRSGPGLEFQAFRQVGRDRLVLLETCESGWCRVQLGDEVGWIATSMLALAVADHDHQH
jgi:uncharacterized protein YgiM (DUF1202 family)